MLMPLITLNLLEAPELFSDPNWRGAKWDE